MVVDAESSSTRLLHSCGVSNSFAFMRLLQKTHHFSSVSEGDNNNNKKDIFLGSDHHQVCRRDCSFMADQEEPRSTTSRLSSKDDHDNNNSNSNNNNNNTNNEAEDHEMRQEGWLRLSTGHEDDVKQDLDNKHQTNQTAGMDSFLELNLYSGGSNREERVGLPLMPSIFHHQHQPLMFPTRPDQETIGSWAAAFRTPFVPQNLVQPSSSSSSSLSASLMMPFIGPYFGRSNFQHQLTGNNNNNNPDVVAGPSSSFRVIDPPRRPHSGIWFLLQASQNQTREPFLPQIPKSYLRIKDGKMTVRILMKYLVSKLRLEHESQVEIRCRGQELEPVLTLQHVRDTIWRGSRDNSSISQNLTLLPNSSTSDHLMVLHYGRTLF
ncbi:RING finger protein [Raphanus sativus]|uniref:Protein LAX PANICLE 2 isoform X2 n=1 Tax=Raphanus sativus TaxID=3726 RepID=A0A6J0KEA5_RAPSA|nr:protein LAX PANICLE 2 isoform X2 [Raphanus sativus]KAJ4882913.1 RING finger protein [Raphanus sativus]